MASSIAGPSGQPRKPPVVQPSSGNAIIINPCQRLNPMLDCIRNVNKEFGDIIPDFQLGRTTCALFLSLKYHRLHPEYIHQRIQKLGQQYTLRLLILMCDVSEHQEPIRELTKICIVNNITIIVCWSNEEAGMYLATYKAFEHKPPDLIKERVDKEYSAMLRAALTSISKVNKTDVETLRTTFSSFAKIAHAAPEDLRLLPGFGQVKVRRIVDAFDKPFRNKTTSALPLPSQMQAEMQLRISETEMKSTEELEEDERGLLSGATVSQAKNVETGQHQKATSNYATTQSTTITTQRVHDFGSAANMSSPNPSTSVPPRASGSTSNAPSVGSRAREPSPVWDIELDLNFPEEESERLERNRNKEKKAVEENEGGVDPRLAEKKGIRRGNDENGNYLERTERRRSPSPVWDIELDLNDDDL